MILILIVGFLNLNSSCIVKDFINKYQTYSPDIKRLQEFYYSKEYSVKISEGKYDTFLYSNAKYEHQTSKLSNSFPFQTQGGTTVEVGVNKNTPYGFNLNLSHSYQDKKNPYSFLNFGPDSFFMPVTSFSINIPLVKNIIGINDRRELRNIDLETKKTREDFLKDKETLILNVLKQFINLNIIKEQVEVTTKLRDSTKKLYDVISRQRKIGSVEERYFLWADSNFLEAEKNLIEAKRIYESSLLSISADVGFDVSEFLSLNFSEEYIDKIYNKVENIENKNRNLSSIKLDIDVNKNTYKITKNQKLPEFNLTTGISFMNMNDKFSSAYDGWGVRNTFVGVSFIWDIFNTSPKFLAKATEHYLDSLNFLYESSLSKNENTIKVLEDNIAQYENQLKYAQNSAEKLYKRHKLEWEAFNIGRSSMRDVVEAQRYLAVAEIEVLKVKYNILDSIYTLAFEKGSLIDFIQND